MGRLNFAGQFVTDYCCKVRMFYALTRKTRKGEWTRVHTDMLNDIADKICNCMQLGLIDMSRGVCIHVGL